MGFTSCKAEQPLQGMALQKKEENAEKYIGKLFSKKTKIKVAY